MTRPLTITTPMIYYVNDRPHLGTAYSTVGADVMARYGLPLFPRIEPQAVEGILASLGGTTP